MKTPYCSREILSKSVELFRVGLDIGTSRQLLENSDQHTAYASYPCCKQLSILYLADKTKKLKQAKEEAAADIEQYRNECEAKFREQQKNVSLPNISLLCCKDKFKLLLCYSY